MPLVDKALPDLQAFQEQARLRGNRFTDLEGIVAAGFDNEDVLNSLWQKASAVAQLATPPPRMTTECVEAGDRRIAAMGRSYSSGVLEFIGHGSISTGSGGPPISSSWLATSRYCNGL